MRYLRFLPKIIIVYSGEKTGFDYKNYYKHNKLANFWLNIICKINYKILVVILYISLRLGSKKIQPI